MPVADLILKNANVITVDPAQPNAELVVVRGDRVLLVAGNEELDSVRGAKTRVIDCQGKTLVPGFNDAHCHIFSFIRKLLTIDLSPSSVNSISDIKAVIRRQAQNTPPRQWLTGTDYNDFYLAEKRHPMMGCIREKVMPPLSEAEITEGITLANEHYLSQGITSLQDVTVVNDFRRWQSYRRFKDTGRLKSRLYMMSGRETLGRFQEAGLTFGSGDSHLRLGGVKILPNEATGQLYPPQPELNQQVLDIHRAGFQVAIHAIQESMVAAAITALEYAQGQLPQGDRRHRIEHCSECPPGLLGRLKRLPAMVVTQPPFLYYSGERYLVTVPTRQLQWLYRIKSFLDSGLVVAAGSDSPIVPDNPLMGIYAAVTRQAESGQQLLPEECISASQALAMYTINAAYASFEEGIKGSITPGKLADLVLLSDDPTRVPPEQIKEVKVEMTIIGGEVVWEA
ncbi:Adenine deaminase [subsurface metagenome]